MQHPELARILLTRSYFERRPPQDPFILASGQPSWFYFDCEKTTSFAKALPLIGEAFYGRLQPEVVCVGGLTRGADPIAECIAYYSADKDRAVNAFSVRKELKPHGTPTWVEGSATVGEGVALVDDVVTSGRSVVDALERCRREGLRVVQVLLMVDREEQNGVARIRDAAGPGVPVEALFRFSELQALRRELYDRQPVAGEHRDLAGAL